MEQGSEHRSQATRDGWSVPLPETLPEPGYWPAALAFGIIFFLWGFVTTYIVSAIGLAVMVAALVGWIGALRHGH